MRRTTHDSIEVVPVRAGEVNNNEEQIDPVEMGYEPTSPSVQNDLVSPIILPPRKNLLRTFISTYVRKNY
jgi:hypothetical protein